MGTDLTIKRVKKDLFRDPDKVGNITTFDELKGNIKVSWSDMMLSDGGGYGESHAYELEDWCADNFPYTIPEGSCDVMYQITDEFVEKFIKDWKKSPGYSDYIEVFENKLLRRDKYFYFMIFDW